MIDAGDVARVMEALVTTALLGPGFTAKNATTRRTLQYCRQGGMLREGKKRTLTDSMKTGVNVYGGGGTGRVDASRHEGRPRHVTPTTLTRHVTPSPRPGAESPENFQMRCTFAPFQSKALIPSYPPFNYPQEHDTSFKGG